MLLRRYGAADDIAATDRFLAACQHADRAAVEEQLTQDLGLSGRLTAAQQAAAEDNPPAIPTPTGPTPTGPTPIGPTPIGSPPYKHCSRQAPRPRTSASHPTPPSHPAPKSRPSCAATVRCPSRDPDLLV